MAEEYENENINEEPVDIIPEEENSEENNSGVDEYVDINVVIENLAELLTNSTNMASVFYDIFLNPVPMDVTLKQYNDENKLVEITIPNRAKDRIALTGQGNPEGVKVAPPGTFYIDTVASLIYLKMYGTDSEGWTAVLTAEALEQILAKMYQEIDTDGTDVVLKNSEHQITSRADISNICANKSLSNLNSEGNGVLAGKASVDLSNLSTNGKARIAIKEYLETETYSENDVVMSVIEDRMRLFRSISNNNTNNDLLDTNWWEEVPLGGSSRCIGEIVTSTIPLVDAGLHIADGSTVYGNGIYADFVNYMKEKFNSSTLYAYEYVIGATTHRVFIKDKKIVNGIDPTGYPEGAFNTNLYNSDGTIYTGSDFIVSLQSGVYGVYYVGSGLRPPQGACTYNYDNNVYLDVYTDVAYVGDVLDENGVLGGFSTTSYTYITTPLYFGNYAWQMFFKVRTGADVQEKQFLNSNWNENAYYGPAEISLGSGKFGITLSSDGTSTGKIGNDNVGTHTVQPNTTYFLLLEFTGEEYHLKYSLTGFNDSMTTDISVTSSVSIANMLKPIIGADYGDINSQGFPHIGAPWLGSIDLNQCWITRDGVTIWNGRMPSGFITEYEHFTTIDTYGTCGKYAYNTTHNSLRIPCVFGIIEGTINENELGFNTEAGVPNITGECGSTSLTDNEPFTNCDGAYSSGALTLTNKSSKGGQGTGDGAGFCRIKLNASNSNPIYGNSDTVQPKTMKLLFYIVISTSTKIDIESNIDRIASDLARKVDKSSLSRIYPIIEVSTGTNDWYRVYADGWCEQGGIEPYSTSYSTNPRTRTLSKPYRDEDYAVFLSPYSSLNNLSAGYYIVQSKTASSFTTFYTVACCWYACGYLW